MCIFVYAACVCVRVYVQMYISILGCMYIVYVYASSPKTGLACLHFLGGVGWSGACKFAFCCTCTHTWCYTTDVLCCTCTHTLCRIMVMEFFYMEITAKTQRKMWKKNCDCCPSCRLLLTYMVCCIDAVAWSGNVTVRYRTMAIEAIVICWGMVIHPIKRKSLNT